ncbi:MAG: hypothetical protein KTR31_16940 [Myxococcales bacterium]|nr:hypothetical protein [Myxococcales bacterium]
MVSLLAWITCLSACEAFEEPEGPPPEVAAVEVIKALDDAARLASEEDQAAFEAWSRAFDRFEKAVEPALRERVSPEEVVATEHRFAVIHAALGGQGDPTAEVAQLAARLHEQLAVRPR